MLITILVGVENILISSCKTSIEVVFHPVVHHHFLKYLIPCEETWSIHSWSSRISSVICIWPCFFIMYVMHTNTNFLMDLSLTSISYSWLLLTSRFPSSLIFCGCACAFAAYNHWADKKWRMVSEGLCTGQSSRVWRCKSGWCKCCFWRHWGLLCLHGFLILHFVRSNS